MIALHLSSKGFQINSETITFPVSLTQLKACLNENYRTTEGKNTTVFTWDDLGLLAYSKDGEMAESITVAIELEDYAFSPKQIFGGIFYFNNQDIVRYYKSHKQQHVKLFKGDRSGALVVHDISAWFSVRSEKIEAIEISTYTPYVRGVGIPKDKYSITPLDKEVLTFVDFGFKLSIIEELMYMKGLMKPVFDLYEFADWYQAREIDIDDEGYEPIAEVTQYFKDLPIPKRLASEITNFYQDGGNDIYMNLCPFSGGAVEYWDIKTAIDARQFPNLKKVTLCYATDEAYKEFEQMGIEAEWL
ncbi:DUF6892 domain-containing protein [Winogradskyella arenosi]|uniref:Uncharacterized protein n=1 Tax=Winogradskyella arenosi TaxID=533325 RepID=A0A368ZGV8_9FLAO|nr:hypothetical protein [Winogradskyella arenosi]RCW92450.1 hypothetical protein DFQ08_102475 [Winogradskyella arenosi]